MSSSDLSNERTAAKTILGVAGSADTPPLIAIGAFGDNTNGGVEAFLDHALTRTLTPPPYGDDDPGPDTDGDLYNSVETVTGSNSSVGTDIADALSVANTALNGGTSGHQVVILVSDGDPNEPTNSTDAREAAYLTSDSIKLLGREIFTMHFGSDPSGFAGKELLAAIATGTAPVPSTDGHNTHGHQTGSANDQATAALENSDGDHFFISPTAADMTTVMTTILTQYCQSVPSPTPTETPTVTPTPTVTLTYTLSPTLSP
ncbi:MAG TPA: hypothetical protein VMT89_04220, partial [Candidatus Acidoferrales bacterium]|nr:hypothetical protein [Candidatus Acidoferrales bacterium]